MPLVRRRDSALITALVVAGCNPSGPAASSPNERPRQTATTSSSEATQCFVGPVHRNEPTSHTRPNRYCVDDVLYAGASHRLGRINLFGVTSDPDPGAYLRVEATKKNDLFAALEREGACQASDAPMPQMRGDWPPDEGMYFTSQASLRSASYLRAHSIAELDFVRVEGPAPSYGGHKRSPPDDPNALVSARISNPFEFPLDGLTVVFHYEGGRGKPMPRYREQRLAMTAPGAETTATAPVALNEGEAWFLFASISVEGTAGNCTFLSSTFAR